MYRARVLFQLIWAAKIVLRGLKAKFTVNGVYIKAGFLEV